MSDSRPARLKGFSVPYRALSRVNMKKHCARASRFVSDWKCINCNSICPVFLRKSMKWRFSLLIGLGAKFLVTFLRNNYEQRMSQHLSRADSTVGFFEWLCYSSDWTHLRNSTFSISSLSGCKRYKRWNYRMIKSNLLGLQSKLWIRWPLSFGK